MLRKINHSLRFKLTMMLVVLMTLTIFSALGVTWLSIRAFFLEELKYRMKNMYNDINMIVSSDNANVDEIKTQMSKISANGDITMFVLYRDGDNNVVFTNTNENSRMRDSMEALANLLRGQDEKDLSDLFSQTNRGYFIFQQNFDKTMNAEFYDLLGVLNDGSLIALRTSAARFNENITTTMRLYSYVGILAILVGCIAMFCASSLYVKPIHEMAVAARKMSQLDFNTRVSTNSKDEIGELGRSINSMSTELEATISELKTANAKLTKDIEEKIQIDEMRKEFLSHVSHELKTPIALIQGYAEGLKENISDDPESKDFYCEVIMDEADKMNSMVKKLLALNELEFGTDQIKFERFDIVELMRNINASSNILLQQNNVQLHFDFEQPIYVWADEFMIEEVYTNYLTNAIHYAPDGGNVIVSMENKDQLIRINVFNEGNPIPEEELSKIWIKFYKVDKARTREYGGSGIGLSIVAATMKQHGREYGAYNKEDGVVFYFELEMAKQVECITENC